MRKHTDTIQKSVYFVSRSQDFHAVIVEGPAGWGKTTAVGAALNELNIQAKTLGAYVTAQSFESKKVQILF